MFEHVEEEITEKAESRRASPGYYRWRFVAFICGIGMVVIIFGFVLFICILIAFVPTDDTSNSTDVVEPEGWHFRSTHIPLVIFTLLAVGWAVATLVYSHWPCPYCNHAFHISWKGEWGNIFSSKCVHCNRRGGPA